MIIISTIQEAAGINTFMVDKVNTHMVSKDNMPTILSFLRKLARSSSTLEIQEKLNKSPEWLPDKTPYKAKKARHLSLSPTDGDMPSPDRKPSPSQE